jgi:RarD protein
MLVFGTIGLFVKYIPLASSEIALYRAVLASVLIFLFLIISKRKISFKNIKKQLPLLFISGVCVGFNWILLFQAYKYTTVSVATLSYYFAPVLVTLICPIVFKEKMTLKNWVCFAFSTLGIVLITGIGDLSQGKNHLIGVLYGLGAACLYAVVVVINKFIKNVDGIERTFLQFLSAIVVLLPFVILSGGINISTLNGNGLIMLLIVGVVHTGINYCLYFSSLKDLKGQQSAILSYIDPLVAVIISFIALNENLTTMQGIGGLLILGFAILNEIKLSKREDFTKLK